MPVGPRRVNVRSIMADRVSSKTYCTHGFDRYPAKMVPHLARYAIERVSAEGDSVFDPFCGCGTTLVESRVTNRAAYGIDINPLAVLLARVKSSLTCPEKLGSAIEEVCERAANSGQRDVRAPDWLSYWYSPLTLTKLLTLRSAIRRARVQELRRYRGALFAVLAIVARLCSRADPRSPKPFISKRARESRCGRHFDAYRCYLEVGEELCRSLEEFRELVGKNPPAVRVRRKDATTGGRRWFENRRFDALVTSPPYLSAQDYYRASKLELSVLGILDTAAYRDLGSKMIGSDRGHLRKGSNYSGSVEGIGSWWLARIRNRDARSGRVVARYFNQMDACLRECHMVLRRGAKCCLIVGDSTIRGIQIPVHKIVAELAQAAGFKHTGHEVDRIRDRRVPPARAHHKSVIEKEHLLWFRRE